MSSHLDRPAPAETHKIVLTVTTSDDDTFDALLNLLDEYASETLRAETNTMDPLTEILLVTNDGISIRC